MITILEFIKFVKQNKEAGVWLESGCFSIHEQGSNGRSPSKQMSSSMFSFLSYLKIIEDNNYMGFRPFRTFPIDSAKLKAFKPSDLSELFEEFQKSVKNKLKKDIQQLKKASSVKMNKRMASTIKDLSDANVDFTFVAGTYRRYSSTPPRIRIGNQEFSYYQWSYSYKDLTKQIENRIARLEGVIKDDQVNDHSSVMDYKLFPLPKSIANQLNSICGYER